ncbi:MAG: MFS transporter [Planctomycetota bacterium]
MTRPNPNSPTPTPAAGHNPNPRSPRTLALRRQLGWIVVAWMFGSLWMWTISGAAMTQFARGLGLPDWGFGLLAALPFIGTLFQLPASWVQERFGRRKAWFMTTLTLSRVLWITVALIPWIVPASWGGARWAVMLGMIGVSWIAGQMGTPAFMSWYSDLVPRRVRGRYTAQRNTMTLPLALVATVGVGWWLWSAEGAGASGEGAASADLLTIASLIIGFAGLAGTIDIVCFVWVRDPKPSRGHRDTDLRGLLLGPLKDRNFRRYLAYNFTLMLGLGFLGQYVWLFVFDGAGVSALEANLMLVAVPMIIRAVAYPVWGRLVDRLGKKPVLLIAGGMFVFGPVGWLLVTPELIWPGYLLTCISPLAWPGLEIANFNFMLGMAETRKGQRGGTAYVAVNSIVIGVGGALSGLMGGVIAGAIPGFRVEWVLDVPWLMGFEAGAAVVVTYHGVLFLVSMGFRVAALIWASTLHEPRATGTRDALRYMTAALYSNVRQGVLMPTRVVGRASQLSYRLRRRPVDRTTPPG